MPLQKYELSRRSFLAGSVAVLAAAGVGLSGCGSSSKKTDSSGTIYATVAYQSTNCNPIGNTSALFCACGWHVYEGLYEFDFSDYSTFNGLAAMKPQKLNNLQYQIVLRDGAKFSNGELVKSSDVVNAFNRNLKDDTYGAYLSSIKQMTAVNDKTLLIDLNYEFGDLLEKRLAMLRIFPASLSDDVLKTHPIGSGPWMYDQIDGNDGGTVSFAPNPHYNGSKPAGAQRMEWNILLDDTSRTTALTEQSVMACESLPVTNTDLAKNAGATVDFKQSVCMPFFCFNCLKAPFDDLRVRQAFYYAINTEKLIHNQMDDYAQAASCILPKNHPNYHKASNVYTYNPDKARELLKEAGVERIDLTLLVFNNWVYQLAAQVKEDLEDVGINATIDKQAIVWSRYKESSEVLPFDVMLTPGDPSCFGDDADLIMTCWYGDNSWMKGRSCYKKSKNNRFEELQQIMQKSRETTGSESQKYLNQCYDLISEQCPIYPLFHKQIPTGYYPDTLNDFKPISTTGLNFVGASVAQQ